MGAIDKETHDLTFDHVNLQLQEITREIGRSIPEISNLDKLLDESCKKLGKLSVVWHSSNLDDTRRIQKTLFPGGIFYEAKSYLSNR